MSDKIERVVHSAEQSHDRVIGLLERLTEVTRPGAVFGEPTTVGDHTVMTASEVFLAMGYGFGLGGGNGPKEEGASEMHSAVHGGEMPGGYGGGGGGGGSSKGRPVAVVTLGPMGIRVEPVLDLTKVGLAFLMVLGSFFVMMSKMRKA